MKTHITTAAVCLAAASMLSAGPMIGPYDAMTDQAPPPEPMGCEALDAGHWAIAPYGLFLTPDADTDSTFGFGVSAEYFFTRYLGVSGLAQWAEVEDDTIGNYGADLVARYPFPTACIAPYAFAGVGLHDGKESNELLGRVGLGLDWRIFQNHGLFADWAYSVPGGGGGEDDIEDYQVIRLGVKIGF